MAGSAVGVVGTAPISFTDSNGAQRSVPLSALQFSGSTLELAPDWAARFSGADSTMLLAVASARAAAGELTSPPIRPPSPAIAVTATHPGPESNNISVAVTVTADHDHPHDPLIATLQFSATETDTYAGLRTAGEAAMRIGVDTPSDQQGRPEGTGLVVVKSGSVATADNLPVEHPQAALPQAGLDVKAADQSTLFTLVPRADYSGSGELSVGVALDPTGATFTVTATYNSGSPDTVPTVTLLSLNPLPPQVAYLVSASAPSSGAMLPAAGTPVQLSGGGPGMAASGLFYTS
jgi:hypothetical protein